MRRFLAALRFLTIVPVPGSAGTAEDDLAGSVPFFPAVGLLLGAVAAAVAAGLSVIAPPMLAAAGIVVLLVAFSGGLHLDGLSDTADGFCSSRPRDRVLEIMKDSHVGAMGVVAIVCVLLLKFAALAELAALDGKGSRCLNGIHLFDAVFLMPLAGRCAMVLPMAMLDYVRPTGLGSVFKGGRLGYAAVISMLSLLIAAAVFGVCCTAVIVARTDPWRDALIRGGLLVASVLIAILAALLVTAWSRRRIGGATGDVYGTTCEIAETAVAVAMAIAATMSIRFGWFASVQ